MRDLPALRPMILACGFICASLAACGDKAPAPKSEAKAEPAKVEAPTPKPEAKPKAPEKKAAEGKVFFISPKDGAVVPPEFAIEFGVEGKTVAAVGSPDAAKDKTKGHHHLIVDGKAIPAGQVVPKDATHIHYGDGSTKTTVKLEPGEHTLTMQFADGMHQSYGPEWSATIKVKVDAAATEKH